MSSAITIKTKPTTRRTSISFNKLNSVEIPSVLSIEEHNSDYPWSQHQFTTSIENSNNLCYCWSVNGKTIGYLIAMLAKDTADILNIGIDPDFQREGYGTALLNHLIKELRKRHIGEILLEVRAGNKSAIQFYKKQGFEEKSIRKNYYIKNSNNQTKREDGIIMSIRIPLKESKDVL
ncbi:ribosomal protein S18-alanine N-acetyltransferase [Candidatus Thioglobus sp.]|nr:ribosomal protein S18-alanine N-acetyltransferase [Candidatus Thioglobus sp.]